MAKWIKPDSLITMRLSDRNRLSRMTHIIMAAAHADIFLMLHPVAQRTIQLIREAKKSPARNHSPANIGSGLIISNVSVMAVRWPWVS